MSAPVRSPAAQEASRRNGARSKGPRTAKGKWKSAKNAVKHGLRARTALDREQMPEWLREIEREVIRLFFGNVDRIRRERLDELLLAWQQLDRVDTLIDNARARLFAGARNSASSQGPAFMNEEEPDAELRKLKRLHAYRRRFRGQRDRCIYRRFRAGFPELL